METVTEKGAVCKHVFCGIDLHDRSMLAAISEDRAQREGSGLYFNARGQVYTLNLRNFNVRGQFFTVRPFGKLRAHRRR